MIKRAMLPILIVAIGLGAALSLYFHIFYFTDSMEANQVLCEKSFDFGKIRDFRSKLLTHVFLISNLSDHVITIQSIKTSCGCLVAQGNSNIPPHSSNQILARMKIDGSVGVRRQKIVVEYSDRSFSVITLQAFVSDQFMTFPPIINVATSASRSAGTYNFKIIRKTPEDSRETSNFLTLSTQDANVRLDIISGKIEDKRTHLVLISSVGVRIASHESGVCPVIARYSDGAIWPFAMKFN